MQKATYSIGCIVFAFCAVLPANGQSANARQALQFKIAANRALSKPFKIDIKPLQQGAKLGSEARVELMLRNGNNEQVNADETINIQVTTTTPSGKTQSQTVQIKPGENSAQVPMVFSESGLSKIEATEIHERLMKGSNYLLVTPPGKAMNRKPSSIPKQSTYKPTKPISLLMRQPRLVNTSYTFSLPSPSAATQISENPENAQLNSGAEILLAVSGEGDGKVRADGTTSARVALYFVSNDPAPQDVRVWLETDHGDLEQKQLVIKKGEFSTETKWTSTEPVQVATVRITRTMPKTPASGPPGTVQFIEPILAIAFANPLSELSIVELGNLSVRFVGRDGIPIQTQSARPFRFTSDSPRIRLSPDSDKVKAGDQDFSTQISASALGEIAIEAAVPGYAPIKHNVRVTGIAILLFCILGGAMGGLVNHLNKKQRGLPASIIIGVIVALPFTWLYVVLALPNVNANIFHNQLSAFMVSILGGIGGATALKGAAKKAGLDLFDKL